MTWWWCVGGTHSECDCVIVWLCDCVIVWLCDYDIIGEWCVSDAVGDAVGDVNGDIVTFDQWKHLYLPDLI